MSYSHPQEEFLPLDSTFRQCSVPDDSNCFQNPTDSLYDQQNEVLFLTTKISELEKNYTDLEKKYLRKIKELKEQLVKKHQVQTSLTQQLLNLTHEYEEHKNEIQKVSSEIKSALQENQKKKQKQPKIKSVSPKNPPNYSPKRLIRKSLETARKEALLQGNKVISKNSLNDLNKTAETQKSYNNNSKNVQQNVQKIKNNLTQQQSTRISDENSLNSSNQQKKIRKPLYSPPSQTNGPSPKKNLLFNSTKELNIFNNPVNDKKGKFLNNNSPSRRLNISPKQSRNVITKIQNKQTSQKEADNSLPIIQEKPIKKVFVKQYESQKITKQVPKTNINASSPSHRKKASSPQNISQMIKKISNKNIINSKIPTQKNLLNSQQKVIPNKDSTVQLIDIDKKQIKQKLQTQKQKKSRSPQQTNKSSKTLIGSKFSPSSRKVLNNSPTHKKTQSIYEPKSTKLLGNMRQKFDDNIFK